MLCFKYPLVNSDKAYLPLDVDGFSVKRPLLISGCGGLKVRVSAFGREFLLINMVFSMVGA